MKINRGFIFITINQNIKLKIDLAMIEKEEFDLIQ